MKKYYLPPEEIDNLLKNNLIDNNVATKLNSYYQKIKKQWQTKRSNFLTLMFSIIGAILIGLGIITFASINWNNFSRSLQTVISLLPILLSSSAVIYFVYKQINNQKYKEALSVLYTASVINAIILICKINNISRDYSRFLISGILTLPIVYVLDSVILIPVFITMIFASYHEINFNNLILKNFFFTIELFLIAPRIFFITKQNISSKISCFLGVITSIGLLIYTDFLINCVDIYSRVYDYLFLMALFLFCLANIFSHNKKNFFYYISWCSEIFLLFYTYISSFSADIFFKIYCMKNLDKINLITQILFFIFSVFVILFCIFVFTKNKNKYLRTKIIIFALLFLSSLSGNFTLVKYIANLVILIIGSAQIYLGINQNALKNINSGLFLICLIILARFFDSDLSPGFKSIIFILIGCLFFTVNIYINKQKNAS